jgi:protoporphyrinogen oxidase
MLEISGVKAGFRAAPYTSVLVLNIAADKNKCCPSEHWLYIPKSKCGFHRVGFYSNVSESFLPQGHSKKDGMVSIYVEKSFLPWKKPSKEEISRLKHSIVRELQDWNFIGATRIVDATWIDTAYTWEYPGSRWKSEALSFLRDFDIYQAGRYGKWKFQGIAESIIDGRAVAKELLKK